MKYIVMCPYCDSTNLVKTAESVFECINCGKEFLVLDTGFKEENK